MLLPSIIHHHFTCQNCGHSWEDIPALDPQGLETLFPKWEYVEQVCPLCVRKMRMTGYYRTFPCDITPLFWNHHRIFGLIYTLLFLADGKPHMFYLAEAHTQDDGWELVQNILKKVPEVVNSEDVNILWARLHFGIAVDDIQKDIPFPKSIHPQKGAIMLEIIHGSYPTIVLVKEATRLPDGSWIAFCHLPNEHEVTSNMIRYYGKSRYNQPDGFYPCESFFVQDYSIFEPTANEQMRNVVYHLSPSGEMNCIGYSMNEYLANF